MVTEVYELATFLGCKKILETFQTELEKSIQDLISKDKSEVKNLFGAFDALIVIESVCKNKVWTKNELTLLYIAASILGKSPNFRLSMPSS